MEREISIKDLTIKTLDEIIMMWIKDIIKDWKYQAVDILIWEKELEMNTKIRVRFDVKCNSCDAEHTNYTNWELTSILIKNYFWKTQQGKELKEKLANQKIINE